MSTVETRLNSNWPEDSYAQFETVEPQLCPKCGTSAICDTSVHYYFSTDRLAIRCRTCKEVWDANPEPAEPKPYRAPYCSAEEFLKACIKLDAADRAAMATEPKTETWRDREPLL